MTERFTRIRPRRGVWLLAEGFVVLVSILAAFFLESWRTERSGAR